MLDVGESKEQFNVKHTHKHQHLPLKKPSRPPVSFFISRSIYIEVPFRKNTNGKSAFSVDVPAPL